MALQELSPLPPVTGYSALGNVIANAGTTIRESMDRNTERERRRSEQLQDIESARAYSDRVRGEERTNRREDFQFEAALRQGLALKAAMVSEGVLSPDAVDNPDAVKAAWEEMQRRGLDRLYQDLLNTPGDDGKPLLTQADLANPSAIAAAKDALGRLKAKQLQFSLNQQGNAQKTVNDIQSQLASVRDRAQQVSAALDAPMRQFGPNDPEVLQLASQMAEQAKPGSGRNREAVAAMAQLAQKQLNENALMQYAQRRQTATSELQSLRYNEAQLTSAMREAMETFKVAPSQTAPAPSALRAPTSVEPAPKPASAADVAAALDKLMGGRANAAGPAAPTAAPSGPSLLDNPTNDPTIAAGNAELVRRQQSTLQSELNNALKDAEAIDKQISIARVGSPVSMPTFTGGYGPPMGNQALAAPTPVDKAKRVSSLLKAKAENEAKVRALREQLMGPAANVTPPAVNTPGASTPMLQAAPTDWWKTSQPAVGM